MDWFWWTLSTVYNETSLQQTQCKWTTHSFMVTPWHVSCSAESTVSCGPALRASSGRSHAPSESAARSSSSEQSGIFFFFCSIFSWSHSEESRGIIRKIWRPILSAWRHTRAGGRGRGVHTKSNTHLSVGEGQDPLGATPTTSWFYGGQKELSGVRLWTPPPLSLFFSVDLMNDSFNPPPPPAPPTHSTHPALQPVFSFLMWDFLLIKGQHVEEWAWS